MAWYDPAFAFKKSIVIPHGKVSGGSDLLDFPVLISITDPALAAMLNGGQVYSLVGYDFLFTDGAETRELPYEIESYNNSTGALLAWVRVPVLSASYDTVLYLYFGNSTVSGYQASAANVWDSGYKGVWHLNGNSTDSTRNAHNGTDTSITYGSSYGQIAQGAETTAGPSGINLSTSTLGTIGTGDFTIEFWINPSAPAGGCAPSLFQSTSTTGPHYYGPMIFFDPNNVNGFGAGVNVGIDYINLQTINSPTASSLEGTWTHIAYTRASGLNTVYYNGVSKVSFTDTSSLPAANEVDIVSRANTPAQSFGSGAMGDEYRVSSIARSASWIVTEYTNQSSPTSFIIVGQTIPLVGNADICALIGSGVTTAQSGVNQLNVGCRGVNLAVNVSLCGAGETFTLRVKGVDSATGQSYTIATFSGIGLGNSFFTVYPGLQASSTVTDAILPRTWYVTMTPSTSDTAAYTVGASLIR